MSFDAERSAQLARIEILQLSSRQVVPTCFGLTCQSEPSPLATYPTAFLRGHRPARGALHASVRSQAWRPCFSPPSSSSSLELEREISSQDLIGSSFSVATVFGKDPLIAWVCRSSPSAESFSLPPPPKPKSSFFFHLPRGGVRLLRLIFFPASFASVCQCQVPPCSASKKSVRCSCRPRCGMKPWNPMENPLASGGYTGISTPRRRWCSLAPRLRLWLSSSPSGSSCSTSDRTAIQP